MTRLADLRAQPLVIASHNKGKLREIESLLVPFGIEVRPAADYGLDEPEETGASFAENARIKSRYVAEKTGLPALSDDSGLAVDALQGAPGIHSARWAGPERNFTHAMQKIAELLENHRQASRTARFICVLSLAMPSGQSVEFEGGVEGRLVFPPRGSYGFGYDPIFLPEGYEETFGEMPPEAKHRISHRAEAFRKFLDYLGPEERARA